jgi:type I restriction-modification system DNA methylase subunit
MGEVEEFYYSEDRDERVKDTAEVFTPDSLVQEMLESLDIDWENPPQDKTFIDPTCGSGNFLVALAVRNIPIHNIYGVDIMKDNIETCKRRLTEIFLEKGMDIDTINYHLERNIIEADALTYHYQFWWYQDPSKITDCLF